jgi:hypothetical protein
MPVSTAIFGLLTAGRFAFLGHFLGQFMIWMSDLPQKKRLFAIFWFRMGSFSQLLNNMDLPTALFSHPGIIPF